MNKHSFTYSSIAMLVVLAIAITMSPTNIGNTEPSYAQSFDAPSSPGDPSDSGSSTDAGAADDGENFQQFMECLFGPEASEEDISSALEGNSDSTPTEQEIRDCFAPLYNTGTTTTPGSGSTGGTDDTGEDGGASSADSATP